ncbi:hypothetical protein L0664_11685 [Octadecabacter sp. G9-8]|uniref:Uncharacterized protein n=1 Tax=Octadecabacter dasysiphoniae TaxID=2909341 RepID=A0ABS9CX06_9RHOB|nr:hypothetical protein [Octadecabacter dasysiphoniae]MCF2871729.1 hypothetical protein [Octadecabacter dasysiphoniae]
MILWPALIGGVLAVATGGALWRLHLLHRPGIIGLIVIAIAGFWPLFAVASGHDGQLVFHLALFATFAVAAVYSHRLGLAGLALVLVAHGVLDAALFTTSHPGPVWWPAFCAGYDVALGAVILFSLFRKPQTP